MVNSHQDNSVQIPVDLYFDDAMLLIEQTLYRIENESDAMSIDELQAQHSYAQALISYCQQLLTQYKDGFH